MIQTEEGGGTFLLGNVINPKFGDNTNDIKILT